MLLHRLGLHRALLVDFLRVAPLAGLRSEDHPVGPVVLLHRPPTKSRPLERFFLPGTLVHLVLIVQHIGVGLHHHDRWVEVGQLLAVPSVQSTHELSKELRLTAFSAGSKSAVGPPQNHVQEPRFTAWWDAGHALELHSGFPLQNAVHTFDVVRVGACDWIFKRLTVVDSHERDVWQLFQDR